MTLKERLKEDVVAHMKAGNKTALTTSGTSWAKSAPGRSPASLPSSWTTPR